MIARERERFMPKYVIGLDLGTSSVRALLTGTDQRQTFVAGADYDVITPRAGYAEQDPAVWYQKAAEVVRAVVSQSKVSPEEIAGISFSGNRSPITGRTCGSTNGPNSPSNSTTRWRRA